MVEIGGMFWIRGMLGLRDVWCCEVPDPPPQLEIPFDSLTLVIIVIPLAHFCNVLGQVLHCLQQNMIKLLILALFVSLIVPHNCFYNLWFSFHGIWGNIQLPFSAPIPLPLVCHVFPIVRCYRLRCSHRLSQFYEIWYHWIFLGNIYSKYAKQTYKKKAINQ